MKPKMRELAKQRDRDIKQADIYLGKQACRHTGLLAGKGRRGITFSKEKKTYILEKKVFKKWERINANIQPAT